MNLSKTERKFLLSLARKAIEYYLRSQDYAHVSEDSLPTPILQKKRATFVTLTIDDELRGCIGHLEAVKPLYEDVVTNAVAAAFQDPRFMPVSEDEFKKITIEISILTPPKKLEFSTPEELLSQLTEKCGVILHSGPHQSTYLPQVWEQLPDKIEFLDSLCVKAGADPGCWQADDCEIHVYEVEKFCEE